MESVWEMLSVLLRFSWLEEIKATFPQVMRETTETEARQSNSPQAEQGL